MSSLQRLFRTIIYRSICGSKMDQSAKAKQSRKEKKIKSGQVEKSESNDRNENVPLDGSHEEKTTSEQNISTESPDTIIMASSSNKPVSAAAPHQSPSNATKKQQSAKTKSTTSSEKTDVETMSTAISEITEGVESLAIQSKPKGPPINIPPKVELTKAERRAIQEAQRAAKQAKLKPGTSPGKPQDTQQASASGKKATADPTVTPTPAGPTHQSASHRSATETGESVTSVNSKPSKQSGAATTANTASSVVSALKSSNQSQRPRQQKNLDDQRLTLFSHLTIYTRNLDRIPMTLKSKPIHPAIIKLGLQYATRQIIGSNLRCVAFLVAIQQMLDEYEGPVGSNNSSILDPVDLNAKLKLNIDFLTKCRPNAVTMGTAIRYLKTHIERIPRDITIEKAKRLLTDVIRQFLQEKIELASIAIAETYAITKITNDDVILIYGYSSLIMRILEVAINRGVNFRVIIVDSLPQQYGLKSAQRLLALNVKCSYVMINAVPFIISEVTKVLLGAHGLLGNGYVMNQVGTAQISLIAKTHNVPVLVCCETYKFCERVQTDSFVFNELGDPNDIVTRHPTLREAMSSTTESSSPSSPKLSILNMTYDVTPPTFISAVITEMGILPCTSVAVVIRMQNKRLDEICGQEQQFIPTKTSTSNINFASPPPELVQ